MLQLVSLCQVTTRWEHGSLSQNAHLKARLFRGSGERAPRCLSLEEIGMLSFRFLSTGEDSVVCLSKDASVKCAVFFFSLWELKNLNNSCKSSCCGAAAIEQLCTEKIRVVFFYLASLTQVCFVCYSEKRCLDEF